MAKSPPPWFDPNWRVLYAKLYAEMERLRALYVKWRAGR